MRTKRRESRSGEGYHPLLEAGRLDGVASWGLGHKGRHPSWGNGRQKPHGSPLWPWNGGAVGPKTPSNPPSDSRPPILQGLRDHSRKTKQPWAQGNGYSCVNMRTGNRDQRQVHIWVGVGEDLLPALASCKLQVAFAFSCKTSLHVCSLVREKTDT